MKADSKLGAVIKRIGRSSAASAISVPGCRPTPARVMTLTDDEIRAAGFSRPKVGFIKDLAGRVLDGRLDLKSLKKHSDEDVMRQLIAVKEIGRWTAAIYLMFRLGRPDILPADDLGLMNAAQRVYKLRTRPTPDKLRKLGEAGRPHRSVAAWYLWASLAE
jgi:3-methyladenine DNA glycosylase/8-oxoguanine DNA glycosylase